MADFSKSFQIAYDADAASCTLHLRCFDTPNSIRLFGEELMDGRAEELLLELRRICLEFHRLWSFTLPGSDVARLNARATRVDVDARTLRLLEAMKRFNEAEPLFDFTVGALSFSWKRARRLPTAGELSEALSHVGADKVTLGPGYVVKTDPLVKVDVGGAAKGFIADELARVVRAAGVRCADIDLGGNLYLVGEHPDARSWNVSVKIPEGVEAGPVVLEAADASVVTSGSYERFVEMGGVRYQHIVDARTGWPCASDVVSATVVAESSLAADMLATTACLAGSSGFPALAARHPGCSFTVICADGTLLRS